MRGFLKENRGCDEASARQRQLEVQYRMVEQDMSGEANALQATSAKVAQELKDERVAKAAVQRQFVEKTEAAKAAVQQQSRQELERGSRRLTVLL